MGSFVSNLYDLTRVINIVFKRMNWYIHQKPVTYALYICGTITSLHSSKRLLNLTQGKCPICILILNLIRVEIFVAFLSLAQKFFIIIKIKKKMKLLLSSAYIKYATATCGTCSEQKSIQNKNQAIYNFLLFLFVEFYHKHHFNGNLRVKFERGV